MPQNALSQTFLAVLLFVLLGFLLWRNTLNPSTGALKQVAETDQRFTGFVARQFGVNGDLQWTLNGTAVQHGTGDRGYDMQNPVITVEDRQQQTPPWQLSAPLGTADAALTEIRLSGGVTGQRAAYNQQGPLRFTTKTLLIEPKTQTAHSADNSQFAELGKGGNPIWHSESIGFRLNYKDQHLEQFKVRDHYQPPAITNTHAIPTKQQSDSSAPSASHRPGAQP
ncbi:MAG: LPS export ABC transporter periplasmic protein LptC [Halothiobacillus sp.]|jgi:LPS export ABC transporter protein LptC|nr:LPS export ABC transporter periplasmic protein LptC [Halothiobacillus sp.]